MKSVYLIFSGTPYKMGKFIRFFTREKYNHASVSLTDDFKNAYTFSRRYLKTPFYGGLVKDSPSRYAYKSKLADIAICKLDTDGETYGKIKTLVEAMYGQKDEYLYNLFAAIRSLSRKRLPIEKSYTCIEFCIKIVSMCDGSVNANGFYTVGELFEQLKRYCVYEGTFNYPQSEDVDFLNGYSHLYGLKMTVKSIWELVKRYEKKST